MPSNLSKLLAALSGPTAKTVGKYSLGAGAGMGLSALENHIIQDPGLEKVNLGLGAVTGGLVAGGGKGRLAALSGLMPKQVGLLAADAYMKDAPMRFQTAKLNQQAAADSKLTAQTQLSTAQQTQANQGKWTPRDKVLAALAAAGVGATGLYGLNSLRAKKKPSSTNKEVLKGDPAARRKQKLRIDVPADSLPPEFFQSLINADDRNNALTTLNTKSASFVVVMDREDVLAGLIADLDCLFPKSASLHPAVRNQLMGHMSPSDQDWALQNYAGTQNGANAMAYKGPMNRWNAGAYQAPSPAASYASPNGPSVSIPSATKSRLQAPQFQRPAAPSPFGGWNAAAGLPATPMSNVRPYSGPMSRASTPAAPRPAPWQSAAGVTGYTPSRPAAPSNGTISYQGRDGRMNTINNVNSMSSSQLRSTIAGNRAPTTFGNGLPVAGNQNSALRGLSSSQLGSVFKASPSLRPTGGPRFS